MALQELNSNIMITKEIKIEVPAGYEIDRERSTFDIIRLKKKEVEFEHFKFDGAYIDMWSEIKTGNGFDSIFTISEESNKNVWISEAHAKASLAMSQLSVLMASPTYNGGWVADWEADDSKYVIQLTANNIETRSYLWTSHFLSFKTKDVRDRFLENHRDLILEAKILL